MWRSQNSARIYTLPPGRYAKVGSSIYARLHLKALLKVASSVSGLTKDTNLERRRHENLSRNIE